MQPALSIVSICYNSSHLFLSHGWNTFIQNTDTNIILVDNGSPDNSGQILASNYPHHHVLQLGRNLGYGRAANAGIGECKTRFVLLLNPDISITAGSIKQLLEIAISDSTNTAIWAPVLKETDYSNEDPYIVEAVTGAAMLFDLNKLKSECLFDENIFLYSEETDLCYRIRQLGYSIKLCPSVFIDHEIDGSSGHNSRLTYMKSWHFGWSRCYFLNKHNLYTKKRNPKRMYRYYKIKSYISLSKINRLRYKGQAAGVKAFLDGQVAFTADDEPQMSTFL